MMKRYQNEYSLHFYTFVIAHCIQSNKCQLQRPLYLSLSHRQTLCLQTKANTRPAGVCAKDCGQGKLALKKCLHSIISGNSQILCKTCVDTIIKQDRLSRGQATTKGPPVATASCDRCPPTWSQLSLPTPPKSLGHLKFVRVASVPRHQLESLLKLHKSKWMKFHCHCHQPVDIHSRMKASPTALPPTPSLHPLRPFFVLSPHHWLLSSHPIPGNSHRYIAQLVSLLSLIHITWPAQVHFCVTLSSDPQRLLPILSCYYYHPYFHSCLSECMFCFRVLC